MSTSLNGRLSRLERAMLPMAATGQCRGCGLPHVRLPISFGLAEAIVRRALNGDAVEVPRLCLCTDCCSDGLVIARRTHRLPPGGRPWSA
jgi:hypothetical protein